MTSIITHEIEERYPYPDNGERPVTQTRLGACLASRKAYRAGATRNPTDREIDMAALAIYTGTSGMSVEEVLPLWPDMNPDAKVQYRRLARLAITAARTAPPSNSAPSNPTRPATRSTRRTPDMYRGTITLALLRWIGHLEQFSQITNQQDKDDA